MNVMRNIGDLIIKLRTDFDITQEDLANALGVSKPAVSQWEHGKGIKTNHIYDVAKFFDVTVDELCAGKLYSETTDAYIERNYDLSKYDFEGPITKGNINKLERFYHCVCLIKEAFIELLPKWAKDDIDENEKKEFKILSKYFKFDSRYYSFFNDGRMLISFSQFGNAEKEFVSNIVDKVKALNFDEQKWELSKIYCFDNELEKRKQREVFESRMVEPLRIMLPSLNQPSKDSLLMGNLKIEEEHEVNNFFQKMTQKSERELNVHEIEERKFFKTMLDCGCQCMLKRVPIPSLSENDTFGLLEGRVVEAPLQQNDKLENIGLFMDVGGHDQFDAITNWKLYSYKQYRGMVDTNKTKYLKALVCYRESDPIKYFDALRNYYEQNYLEGDDEIC